MTRQAFVRWRKTLLVLNVAMCLGSGALPAIADESIALEVDLRDAPRGLLHFTERIPVSPGPVTLAYPKWIPNVHATGPIAQQVGMILSGRGGQTAAARVLSWQRDPLDPYLYRVMVPKGIDSLEVRGDFVTASPDGGSGSTDANIAVLDWNTVPLYPYEGPSTRIGPLTVAPSIILPEGWHYATALESLPCAADSSRLSFRTVSLERLVDSPVLAGRYFREVALAPEVTPKHYLDMVADQPADLQIDQAHIDALSQVVRQAGAMFQSRHYDIYRMLVTLSDHISGGAVDHQQSLDNRRRAKFLTDPVSWDRYGNFLAHDYLHSWNGNYRRPVGLCTANFQVPVDTTGLWVSEGLTQYLSSVVAVRAGIWTRQQFIEHVAADAAGMEHRPGREWRDLQDTSSMAYTLWANDSSTYDNWRRNGFDFYTEGALIWLEVDATIRNESHGTKTLDDFLARFFGPRGSQGPALAPYTLEALVADLQAILPFDWKGFFDQRLHAHGADAPLGGVIGSGYRLVYRDTPASPAVVGANPDLKYSIGMVIRPDGVIADVLKGDHADGAGFAPGMKVLEVQGRPFTLAGLQRAVREAPQSRRLIGFQVDNSGVTQDLQLDAHDGERYPYLERVPDTVDRLAEITEPLLPENP